MSRYIGDTISDDYRVDVELIDAIISHLKKKVESLALTISAKHLPFTRSVITYVLTKLFNIMLVNGIVHDSFSTIYAVPIPKCDVLGKAISVHDF